MLGVSEGIIEEELDVRHVAQLQISTHFPPDHAPGALQPLVHLFPSLVLTDQTVVDAAVWVNDNGVSQTNVILTNPADSSRVIMYFEIEVLIR